MTKREMIAMLAMQAILSSEIGDFDDSGGAYSMHESVTIESVRYAHALLKELEK